MDLRNSPEEYFLRELFLAKLLRRSDKRTQDVRPLVALHDLSVIFGKSKQRFNCFGRARKWGSKGEAMSGVVSCVDWANSVLEAETRHWYALTTLSRHEWLVTKQLQSHGLEPFLPIKVEIHRWSDRRKKVEVPLFPGYIFLHANMCGEIRHTIRRLRGCGGFITMHGDPVPIPDEQISGIQKILEQRVPCTTYSCLTIGRRVRVRGGSLDGIEGILTRTDGENSLVISVNGIGRSVAVRIEGYPIEQL